MSHLWERNFKKQHQKKNPKKNKPKKQNHLKRLYVFPYLFLQNNPKQTGAPVNPMQSRN